MLTYVELTSIEKFESKIIQKKSIEKCKQETKLMICHEFCFCKHHNKGHVQFLFFCQGFRPNKALGTYVEIYEYGSSSRKFLVLKLLLIPCIRNNLNFESRNLIMV